MIFDVPVDLCLELVAVVRPYPPDMECETLDQVVEAVDGVGLGGPAVNLWRRLLGMLQDPQFALKLAFRTKQR